jgi:PAS domain S-box-containing protein
VGRTGKDALFLPSEAHVTIETFYERLHPDDREPTRRAIERSIADMSDFDTQYRTVDPDTGSIKWIRPIGRTFYDDDGAPIRFDGVTLDITSRKTIEDALRDREERLRLAQESGGIGVWEWSPSTGEEKISPGMSEIYGHTAGEIRSYESWRRLVHPDDILRIEAEREAAIAEERPFDLTFRVLHGSGDVRWVTARGKAEYGPSGEVLRVLGINADVTVLKRAEERLGEADKRKDEFLATLAHELRNPLAPVRNALSIMERPNVKPETVSQLRALISRQVDQLTRLVDDLLDVSRITTGKVTLQMQPVDLNAVIERAIETSKPLIDSRKHTLALEIADEPLVIRGDAVRMTQVLANLLHNAAKYTNEGGKITLSASRHAGDITIRVTDSGVGLSPDMIPLIFDLFTQADTDLARSSGGLGIGLTLVKKLVELHNGSVVATSMGLGHGSTFEVRIPADVSPVGRSSTRSGASVDTPPRRILVVDDNIDSAESLSMLLTMMGHTVATSHDGIAALDLARDFRPDIAILDIGLPGRDGYELARILRRDSIGNSLLLIALSGYGQEEGRRRSRDSGFHYHLTKPIVISELEALLHSATSGVHGIVTVANDG